MTQANRLWAAVAIVALMCAVPAAGAARQFVMIGVGDSLGEGVQSGDANLFTQPHNFLNLVASRLTIPFPQPYIKSNPLGVVGEVYGRSRINPFRQAANLAVSGADVDSLLRERADRLLDAEVDLVLAPQTGSQMEVAEALDWFLAICWIGSNDVLGAITSWDNLNGSQVTPVAEFEADFREIVQRLSARNRAVVAANIPDVTQTAYLLDGSDLIRLSGSDHGLPAGHLTSAIAGLLLMLGAEVDLTDPDLVLDPAEQALIQQRVGEFNQIISTEAAILGIPVVDIHSLFNDLAANPPEIGGLTITNQFLGGLFSLDGIHPSNIGHALVANAVIGKMNEAWGSNLPLYPPAWLDSIARRDPFVDKDGDGSVPGRPFTSLLETVAFLLGIGGDFDDADPGIATLQGDTRDSWMRRLFGSRNLEGEEAKQRAIHALERAFGVDGKRP